MCEAGNFARQEMLLDAFLKHANANHHREQIVRDSGVG
jgi:hypothetical protein